MTLAAETKGRRRNTSLQSDRLRTAPAAPVAKATSLGTVQALLLAVVATVVPVLAHTVSMPIGVAFAVGIALVIAAVAPASIPVVIVFSFVFQNTVVAMITPLLDGQQSFTMARSYNFMLVATFWGMVVLYQIFGRVTLDAKTNQVLRYSYATFILVGIYFVIGALHDANGAVIYLRNIATPLMCLQIGLVIAARFRPDFLPGFAVIAALALVYGFLELIFQMDFLRLFNGDTYIRMLQQDAYDAGFLGAPDAGHRLRHS